MMRTCGLGFMARGKNCKPVSTWTSSAPTSDASTHFPGAGAGDLGRQATVDELDGLRDRLLPEPGRPAAGPEPDRPEGRGLRRAPARLPHVTLTNLNGSGYLVGDWANIRATTGMPAYSATNQFLYHRNDDRFEQVMAYYWATEAQEYIQSLGFGSTRRAVNKRITGHPDRSDRHR